MFNTVFSFLSLVWNIFLNIHSQIPGPGSVDASLRKRTQCEVTDCVTSSWRQLIVPAPNLEYQIVSPARLLPVYAQRSDSLSCLTTGTCMYPGAMFPGCGPHTDCEVTL